MHHLVKLKKVLKSSPLTVCTESYKAGRNAGKTRALTENEIAVLEKNGNHCENWADIVVDIAFDPNHIYHSIFSGKVHLPTFYGTVLIPGDVSFPTGIYSSHVHDCIIENSLVHSVSLISNILVRQGAVLQNIGSLACNGNTHYQIGSEIYIGNEMGGRKVRIFPDINQELVETQLFQNKNPEDDAAFAEVISEWREEVSPPFGVIEKGAVISNTGIIRNSWIGPNVRVDGAAKIRNSTILSSLENPTGIYDAVILDSSCVQEGSLLYAGAQIHRSVLMKKAKVGKLALIHSSIIAPCCQIEEAEVTSSFVGPLTQIHHHSLLISALWTAGGGNIGYGANIGSNHTGRMPDQEIYPGQGFFFGLGVNVKYPANFSEAPFSVIASGITTEPQRLRFPFSLIKAPSQNYAGISENLNELLPAWNYGKNAYGLERNAYKYAVRRKGVEEIPPFKILNAELAKLVLKAYHSLNVEKVLDVYTEEDIPGLGSNYLREANRMRAKLGYANYLERFFLDAFLTLLESSPALLRNPLKETRKLLPGELFKDIARIISIPETLSDLIKRYRHLEKQWFDSITESVERDAIRGKKIFDDYEETHPADSAFMDNCTWRLEEAARRSNALLKEQKTDAQ
ncbi:MAG: DUF4954 family protein [Fibrobacter sp.]|jgi:hypothetical protein|nr:DUF4954 family protein [Fibrobacter sp.]